jgi:hypothetical protein
MQLLLVAFVQRKVLVLVPVHTQFIPAELREGQLSQELLEESDEHLSGWVPHAAAIPTFCDANKASSFLFFFILIFIFIFTIARSTCTMGDKLRRFA